MSAFKGDVSKCFKCKSTDVVFLLNDPELTKGNIEFVCKPCYMKLFPKYEEEIK